MNRQAITQSCIFVALVAGGAATRLAYQDVPNFAPVAALALFAGLWIGNLALAALVPLTVMAVTDLVIGGYDLRLMATVYAALTFPVLLRGPLKSWLTNRHTSLVEISGSLAGLFACSLAASVGFFVTTNFACWLLAESYAKNAEGLLTCYTAALPFFRYTLLGDAIFSVSLAGIHLTAQRLLARSPSIQASL